MNSALHRLALAFLWGLAGSGARQARASSPVPEAVNLVAMVEAGNGDPAAKGQSEKGAAIVVGFDSAKVYLITAEHVVKPCLSADAQDACVQLAFRDGRSSRLSARVVPFPGVPTDHEDGDVADIIGLAADLTPAVEEFLHHQRFDCLVDVKDHRPGTEKLHAVGNQGGEPWNFTVIGFRDTTVTRLRFGANNARGASGGAILDDRGSLVGMTQQEKNGGFVEGIAIQKALEWAHTAAPPFTMRLSVPLPVLRVAGQPAATLRISGSDFAVPAIIRGPSAADDIEIKVVAPGYLPATGRISLQNGADTAVSYELHEPRPWLGPHSIFYGVGAATLVAGGTTGLMALHARSSFYDQPSKSALDKVDRLNKTTDILLATGIVTLAVGLVWDLLRPAARHSTIEATAPR